eukprot:tig00001038_g6528.t1
MGSLGWLTESSLLPGKRRKIEGVSTRSVVDLKAVLFSSEDAFNRSRVVSDAGYKRGAKARLGKVKDMLGKANAGVAVRSEKDVAETSQAAAPNVSAALAAKARIYERIRRGDLDDKHDRFLVDFEAKRDEAEERREPEYRPTMLSIDMKMEIERKKWEEDAKREIAQGGPKNDEDERRAAHRELLEQLQKQTEKERRARNNLRERRKQAAVKRILFARKQALKGSEGGT